MCSLFSGTRLSFTFGTFRRLCGFSFGSRDRLELFTDDAVLFSHDRLLFTARHLFELELLYLFVQFNQQVTFLLGRSVKVLLGDDELALLLLDERELGTLCRLERLQAFHLTHIIMYELPVLFSDRAGRHGPCHEVAEGTGLKNDL